ncbi:MAG: hypothetical protein QOE09_1025 [Ilumatobacteraceae bacterium]
MTRTATVIGGGPAGLMAAEVLAAAGLRVTVYEHMPSVGRKLLLAGRSGLNITNNEPLEQLMTRYGKGTPRLREAIRSFGPHELRSWCEGLGETTFVGSTGRVFPTSFRATPLLRAWLARLQSTGVTIELRHRWVGWRTNEANHRDGRRSIFSRPDGTTVEAASDVTVLALGGGSWPRVGSDGSWVGIFRGAGIRVNDLRPANCGVHIGWTTHFVERFAGAPLKNVAASIGPTSVRGDATITRYGLESGPVYALSPFVRDALDRDGRCVMNIDLRPDLTVDVLAQRLARRRPKDSLATSLRRAIGLSPADSSLLREATGNNIPTDPLDLATLVKTVPLAVDSTAPLARAISTAGGVDLAEVDTSFMVRRLPGTFLAGEMLDWEAPTGGYLLQASFSTAVAAARGAVAWLDARTTTAIWGV